MLVNYLKTAIRQLTRNRLFSALNILGLATGLCGSIFIFLWVQDELSYDRQHPQPDEIFGVTVIDGSLHAATSPLGMAPFLQRTPPVVKQGVLFGLSAYTTQRRFKEIGVRKVLGASVGGIVRLLAREFLLPVLLATLIAFPAAGWAMDKWLHGFVYRIGLEWWFFAVAGAMALLVALGAVGFQSLKAASANPVKSLRSE